MSSKHPATAVPSSKWIAGLSQPEKDALIAKIKLIQSWINDFAAVLGKRPPKAMIAESFTCYARWPNVIAVPARTLLQVDDRLLRIVVAHECGHFDRRWASFLSRSNVARLGEELMAEKTAMTLTGATIDELQAATAAMAMVEGIPDGLALEEYLAQRRELLKLVETATDAKEI